MILGYGELGYLTVLNQCLTGVEQTDRTGVGTRSINNATIVYPAGSGFGAFSTIRPAALRLAFEEFMFFLRGQTDTKILESKGVCFWKGNTSREFLDARKMFDTPEGDLGAAYSKQWRNFGGVDQLERLMNTLERDRYSRRMVVSLWNPAEESNMPLVPCWWNMSIMVLPCGDGPDKLHMTLNSRSCDIMFGYSFAVQQYRLFQYMLAAFAGCDVGDMTVNLTHIHLYNNQLEYADETLKRMMGKQGEVVLKRPIRSMEDLLSYEWEDIEVIGLEVNKTEYKAARPPMAV